MGSSSPGTLRGGRTGLPLGRESLTARVLRHPLVVLGGPRALLLQLADPSVADAVHRYSSFEQEPFSRLARTFRVMGAIAFGSQRRSAAAAEALRRRHSEVVGTAPNGRDYDANDPRLMMWVHATLVDTVLAVDRRYLGIFSDDERRAYYQETRLVGRALGIPERVIPADLVTFEAYFSQTVEDLEVGEEAVRLARVVLHPRPEGLGEPFASVASLVVSVGLEAMTADLLPDRLRVAYRLDSAALLASSLILEAGSALTRSIAPRLPREALGLMNDASRLAFMGARGA